MTVTCYPIPGKPKAAQICSAFAAGCGGTVVTDGTLRPGPAMFYGVRPAIMHLWQQCKAEQRDWWYTDNSYFDVVREKQFRITKNALQLSHIGTSDGKRFKALSDPMLPWQKNGSHILVCPQTDEFMTNMVGQPTWAADTVSELSKHTDRPIRVRTKKSTAPLQQDLRGAFCLVTHSSAAAVEALLSGIPVVCTGACGASPIARRYINLVESPLYAEREPLMNFLADNQWTAEEIRRGVAWESLNYG